MNAAPTVLPLWADMLACALLIVGAAFALVGAIGLVKLGDFYKRLHAPSKATTAGTAPAAYAARPLLCAMLQSAAHANSHASSKPAYLQRERGAARTGTTPAATIKAQLESKKSRPQASAAQRRW